MSVLKKLEWRGQAEAEPLVRGERGHLVAACPWCGGIEPREGAAFFVKEALGHRAGCELRAALDVEAAGKHVLVLTHVSEAPEKMLEEAVWVTAEQAVDGGQITLKVQGRVLGRLWVNGLGQTLFGMRDLERFTLTELEDGQEAVITGDSAVRPGRRLSEVQSGEMLDLGEGHLYRVKRNDRRGDVLHLILENGGGVWHLTQAAETQLVPRLSQEQETLWVLPESAVNGPNLKLIY